MSLRWGILGTGNIADKFTRDLQATGHQITAVGSRTDENAQKFAAEHGIPRAHGSYEALASDPEVDAIYVSTPHPFHRDNAVLAISQGKHVLVEKAFTLNEREAIDVFDAAAARGVVALEAMWTRWLPHMVRIREIVRSGGLGQVRAVIADHTQSLPTDPEHRLQNPDLGGGALLDLAIYPLSFAVDMLGLPTRVHAIGCLTPTGVDSRESIVLEHGEGELSTLYAGLDHRGPTRAAVIGTDGMIELGNWWYAKPEFTRYDVDGNIVEEFSAPADTRGMHYEAAELEQCVAEGRFSRILSPAETIGIMAVCDEVREQLGVRYPSETR